MNERKVIAPLADKFSRQRRHRLYPSRMSRPPALPRFLFFLLLSAGPGLAHALELQAIQIRGLDPAMEANVRDFLALEQLEPARRATLTEGRLSFYLRNAPREVRAGLEPFGYYDAEVTPRVDRVGDAVTVVLDVALGEPVRVRIKSVVVTGPAAKDAAIAAQVTGFNPGKGEVFNHGTYENSKTGINRLLIERGYFDADMGTHTVEVTRAARAADVRLGWVGGERYLFGPAVFDGSQFAPGLLERLVPWREGQPYEQAELLRLRQSLTDLDYFNGINVTPEPEQATDGKVPVKIGLTPAKRSIYSAGIRYGTDSGAGVSGRVERRWVNRRGHKALADASLAQKKSDVILQYKVPGFALLDGWYTLGLRASDEKFDEINSQLAELSLTRSGRWRHWNLLAGLYYQRERYDAIGAGLAKDTAYSSLLYPSLWAEYKDGDDLNYPRRARGFTFQVRGGSKSIASDVDFLSLRAEGRYIRGLGDSNRLLLRAELGTLLINDYLSLPPSQRFYAGGDRSVRGFGYKGIGERLGMTVTDPRNGRSFDPVFGGKHLAVGSVEFEHMFTPVWGGAVFVDAGDAWDKKFEARVGVGVGLRWRSPVGPVRVDIARGSGEASQGLRLHLVIGPEL